MVIAQLKLGQFEPFVKEYASMQGNLNADVQVRGSASDPNVNGQITFAGPTTVIPKMLGAPLTLTNQTIRFGDQRVNFDQFTLTDAKKRAAVLNGTVNYADLKKIAFELTFKTDGFQFLNSSYGAAESFYGTANLAADLRINGPLDALRVGGRLNTLEETELYLLTYDAGGAEVNPGRLRYLRGQGRSAGSAGTAAGGSRKRTSRCRWLFPQRPGIGYFGCRAQYSARSADQ
jgi:hypothetical protein